MASFSVNSSGSPIRICAWNINGIKNKLDNANVYLFVSQFDIVVISETKRTDILVPGFTVKNNVGNISHAHRGGVSVLVKNYLESELHSLDYNTDDQIWFQLKCFPKWIFGGIYIPPSDSPYFQHSSLAELQERCKSDKYVLLIGDLNARLGKTIEFDDTHITYPIENRKDTVQNNNGKSVLDICASCNLRPINNAVVASNNRRQHYSADLTYRKGNKWISQLDLALVSQSQINAVKTFEVNQYYGQKHFPSDHAPITMTFNPNIRADIAKLASESALLGSHNHYKKKIKLSRPGIHPRTINKKRFTETLADISPLNTMDIDEQNIDNIVSNIEETLYTTAKACRSPRDAPTPRDCPMHLTERWHYLTKAGDSKALWGAINWRGEMCDKPQNKDAPSDTEFKEHFEDLLSPASAPPPFTTSSPIHTSQYWTILLPLKKLSTHALMLKRGAHVTQQACHPAYSG